MTRPELKKVKTLGELRRLAEADPRYAKLAVIAASNLGCRVDGTSTAAVAEALRWLNLNADETNERGVVAEVNGVRDIEAGS